MTASPRQAGAGVAEAYLRSYSGNRAERARQSTSALNKKPIIAQSWNSALRTSLGMAQNREI